MKEKTPVESVEIISIDWCTDTIKESLPWDPDQFIEVRRLTAKEKRRKRTIASKFTLDRKSKSDDIDVQIAVDEIKDFEYTHCITDFSLKGKDKYGKEQILTFSNAKDNTKIYDHFGEKLEEFVDKLISKVNKESDDEDSEEAVDEAEGNSESSSPDL